MLDRTLIRTALSGPAKQAIAAALWDTPRSEVESDLKFYFKYYIKQCELIALHEGGSRTPLATHADIMKIVQLLRASRTREEIHQQLLLSCGLPDSDVCCSHSIDLAARILLMVEFGNLPFAYSGSRQIEWAKGSLKHWVTERFESKPVLGHSKVKLEKIFNANNLGKIAGIEVVWTNNLADHLRLLKDDQAVAVFHHASFLKRQQRKAGNGCITCRIRRVKCDLAKPSCQRCTSSKRQCDGYLPEDSTVTRRQLAEAARQMSVIGPISQALSQYPRDRSRSASPTNLTLFDVFRTLTAPSTASFIPSQFWTRELLQLAHSEPAVWHATLALGALHQRHELFWQGRGYHSGEKLWSQANENYGRAITCARDVKDPTQLLALSLALLSVTNMMGRWSESQVHIIAGHRLLSQAGHVSETSGAAEILTRLDLMAMTFSDSSAPYPYKLAPRTVWIDEHMKTAEIESYGQAGTALFGMMRRLMMLSETTDPGDEEGAAKDLEMLHLTMEDLSLWEHKMAQFEKKHPNPHDETGAVSIRLYHTMIRTFLSGGAFGPETRWDRFLGHYERILTLAETLWSNAPPSQVQSPLSLESGFIVPAFMVAQRCRHPWLRRRAIGFLYKIKRQEGMWHSDGAAAVGQRIMEIEGQKYFASDLASPLEAMEDVPWEAWAETEDIPARTSWAGIERVPEMMRMRETLVMVDAVEKRVELSLIMSSGDDIGNFGEVKSETVVFG
ncbi:hypothetical protein FGLOB1_9670 [Fusarium globosum]|uniref:Zn(2)-C6 fungal-type domain-containing protein n=1 Tax=Fusarium globosum TaxID=78864 RepID=A0A8H5XZ86_9HYPO|nr:hypothetical protein FGLOB1_9670 [Fusarium globosum]